ncbi:unnamed protein product, partial [Fusarium fujikuroi]
IRYLTLLLLFTLLSHAAPRLLLTNTGRGILRSDLLRPISAVISHEFAFDTVKPLLKSALASKSDAFIWQPRVMPNVSSSTRPVVQPNKPAQGSIAERRLDTSFINDLSAGQDSRCRWSQISVPGQLKSNPPTDKALTAWLDIGRSSGE